MPADRKRVRAPVEEGEHPLPGLEPELVLVRVGLELRPVDEDPVQRADPHLPQDGAGDLREYGLAVRQDGAVHEVADGGLLGALAGHEELVADVVPARLVDVPDAAAAVGEGEDDSREEGARVVGRAAPAVPLLRSALGISSATPEAARRSRNRPKTAISSGSPLKGAMKRGILVLKLDIVKTVLSVDVFTEICVISEGKLGYFYYNARQKKRAARSIFQSDSPFFSAFSKIGDCFL
jgi:hypothetical protein